MRVHHLNCGTMNAPLAGRLVCHVLLLETDASGLVLVDTGFGLADIAQPRARLGPTGTLLRPTLDPAEAAATQVEALGFRRDDVRHVVLTHFDLDHIGGLADFPEAAVHVTTAEYDAAVRSPGRRERLRYRAPQWDHGPKIVEHGADGEAWLGFSAATELTEISPGIALVALPGHSRGHACVAVETESGWLLHAGDAMFHRGVLDGTPTPRVLRLFENSIAWSRPRVRQNHERLAELATGHPEVTVFAAHDAVQWEALATTGR
ncbi:MBL fold metallo-hydrolase [Nocardioides sp. GY 10113]|uniref:MBL fold metallo-hydrolase n=1 Tax=Nocardioides sp. GY 10113 TaxID=2569761 RepID=UPI0010A82AE5|nr:MBL fold metallo-hydrolase [Nocardioides sp. GY 10113]TIC87597.1 MBL fold metallo-hydrolase [Nocardioides sp. GY 10113]